MVYRAIRSVLFSRWLTLIGNIWTLWSIGSGIIGIAGGVVGAAANIPMLSLVAIVVGVVGIALGVGAHLAVRYRASGGDQLPQPPSHAQEIEFRLRNYAREFELRREVIRDNGGKWRKTDRQKVEALIEGARKFLEERDPSAAREFTAATRGASHTDAWISGLIESLDKIADRTAAGDSETGPKGEQGRPPAMFEAGRELRDARFKGAKSSGGPLARADRISNVSGEDLDHDAAGEKEAGEAEASQPADEASGQQSPDRQAEGGEAEGVEAPDDTASETGTGGDPYGRAR